ncbi:unnamed protein product [Phytomonas sp. EM1]|nr:unnamed protein product [Phytomonas sp. EM1]|eukprot:CCW59990.1 unnamed protein product [Phytomonas sp. isolate EM1]
MIAQTLSLYRIPVAFFSMKHFRCRQKHIVTPQSVRDTFTRYLDPKDRLLRQSRAGSGSTRVLVLDNLQQVKGVYHPLLCLPHPSVVKGGDQVLGLPVGDYLDALEPHAVGRVSSEAWNELPAVLIMVSHPHGVALTSFTTDGAMRMPLVNLSLHPPPSSPSSAPDLSSPPASSATPEFMEKFVQVINKNYDQYLAMCSTYYFIAKDRSSSLTLNDFKNGQKALKGEPGLDMVPFSKMLSEDSRWITLPDTILQKSQQFSLYVHDNKLNKKVVSPSGLSAAVASGSLELDVPVRRPDVAVTQETTDA